MRDPQLEALDSALRDLRAVTRQRVEGLAPPRQSHNDAPGTRVKAPSARVLSSDTHIAKYDLLRGVSDLVTPAVDGRSCEQVQPVGRIGRVLNQLKLRLRPLLGHWW